MLLRDFLKENPSLLAAQATTFLKCLNWLFIALASPFLRTFPDSPSGRVLSSTHKMNFSLADYVSCLDWVFDYDCCVDAADRSAATRTCELVGTDRSQSNTDRRRLQLDLLAYSLLAGTLNFLGALLAVLCVEKTSAGQSAFFISLFVVFMPFAELLVFHSWPTSLQVGCLM